MNELTLDDIARKYGTDKSTLYHNYTLLYCVTKVTEAKAILINSCI